MRRSSVRTLVLEGEDGDKLSLAYDNRGEPYRQGVTLALYDGPYFGHESGDASVFLEGREAVLLRDKLIELYPLAEDGR